MASVLSSNAFALLDDDEQGNVATDAATVANIPAAKAAPAKAKEEPKPGAWPILACTPAVLLFSLELLNVQAGGAFRRLQLLKGMPDCRSCQGGRWGGGEDEGRGARKQQPRGSRARPRAAQQRGARQGARV